MQVKAALNSTTVSRGDVRLWWCAAGPQLKLFPAQYTATSLRSTSTAAILDRSSRVYTTALEKSYLIT